MSKYDSYQMVAQKIPNDYKLYDMAGNVAEFTNNIMDTMSGSSVVNPVGSSWVVNADNLRMCILRGGCYDLDYDIASAWKRENNVEWWGSRLTGFRCVIQTCKMEKN